MKSVHWLCLPALILFLSASLTACSVSQQSPDHATTDDCPVTEPVWVKPPEDSAVLGTPEYGYYFVNEDRSIWASAWWTDQEENYLYAGEKGIKLGWFRPEGVNLEISGRRIDAQAPPLEAHAPCCYPTRFQATGLMFPTEGCWEVSAKAGNSDISFVVEVHPEE